MVSAILNGSKSQTRRVVKDNTLQNNQRSEDLEFLLAMVKKCPYGLEGDLLWVRETFLNINCIDEAPAYVFKADNPNWIMGSGEHWKPSIHMPKAAARIWLEITEAHAAS